MNGIYKKKNTHIDTCQGCSVYLENSLSLSLYSCGPFNDKNTQGLHIFYDQIEKMKEPLFF